MIASSEVSGPVSADPPSSDVTLPFRYECTVRDDWIDSNRHMNSLIYHHVVRDASMHVFRAAGLPATYRDETGCSIFVRESHIRYRRELLHGAPLVVNTWVAGVDLRSVHYLYELRHAEGWLAATCEYLFGHVDARVRASADWPPAIARAFRAFETAGRSTLPDTKSMSFSVRPTAG